MTSTITSAGIELAGLTKSFKGPDGAIRAVRGVDLSIAPGETVALLGPNGAGKSTTIDMLLGLLRPDSGTVSVFGMTAAEAVRAGAIGVMLQSGGVLHDLTVRELLTMMASLYPRPLRVDEALDLAGIAEISKQRSDKLSGGQTQRVRFALAMISNPDLLVLDEPTVALDVEARRDFWATIRGFGERGKTVIFATHYLEEADTYADRIILLARGDVVADGSATEIKARVGSRIIRATLPDIPIGVLEGLSGVVRAERHGQAITLTCSDSDSAIRALLSQYAQARDINISGAGLEQAFLELTSDSPEGERA